jgi:hypothetical protein
MKYFVIVLFLAAGLIGSFFIPASAHHEDGNPIDHSIMPDKKLRGGITLHVEPKQLKYEERFTINATAHNYQNNDQWYFINISDPNGKEIFSTEWYTYAPFVFQVWTGSPCGI